MTRSPMAKVARNPNPEWSRAGSSFVIRAWGSFVIGCFVIRHFWVSREHCGRATEAGAVPGTDPRPAAGPAEGLPRLRPRRRQDLRDVAGGPPPQAAGR